ncbi:hypothetical protein [Streptomyces sp. NPDC095613]|uniref:hypothetical protein n=1 Tax=Streptomyces sp. NPDC095613 TaxID=3155540 RepID=UPI003318ED7A
MTTYALGIQLLSARIGVEPEHVDRALAIVSDAHESIQAYSTLSDEEFERSVGRDRHVVAVVANLAMRFAGRIEDAHLLMDVYKASEGVSEHRVIIREGVGTLPEHHGHRHVETAIRILYAADLPPIHTDGTHVLRPGFQVQPVCDDLPGWTLITPDPDCDGRGGFAGGRLGYLAVMRWAGWGIVTEPLTDGRYAVCHPDYRDQPFPT